MAEAILRGMTLTVEQKLITETCCNCGLLFAMTEDFKNEKLAHRDNHNRRTFYCPNGHAQHYLGETEEQKLKRRAAELKREADELRRQRDYQQERRQAAENEATHQRARANGYKGHATRITKRAKAGVCPCCNRTVSQLARHMATQHPDFTLIALEQTPEGATVQ